MNIDSIHDLRREFKARGVDALGVLGDIFQRDTSFRASVLFYDQWLDDVDLLRLLLRAGADVNAVNRAGATALYYAAGVVLPGEEDRRKVVCEILLDSGAQVNFRHNVIFYAPPRVGVSETALMVAARTGAKSIVSLLLERGANRDIVDGNGLDARAHALRRGYGDIVALLLAKSTGTHRDS